MKWFLLAVLVLVCGTVIALEKARPLVPLTFQLTDRETAIAVIYDGRLMEGKRLSRFVVKLNELVELLDLPANYVPKSMRDGPNDDGSPYFRNLRSSDLDNETYEPRSEPDRGQPTGPNDRRK